MLQEKRLAVLIDSDNVSAKYAQFIMQEVEKYGIPTYKRVYGDWEKGGNGWHNAAINYSIMAVQQCSYIAGKNATDFSMIIDAMDILYTGNVDGFCLVTSDSDFTRLAIRLREAGKLVVGIGELKTPRAFTVSCHHFCYLNQLCEPEGMQDEKTIRKAVLEYVQEHNDERIDLARVSAVLTSRFGNINFDELGYKRFSSFIDSFKELRRSNTFVSMKKKKAELPAPAISSDEVTEEQIVAAIKDYFSEYAPQNDNMMKIESYLAAKFGKIDFSRFGSKRFAKFIDKQDNFKRTGTFIEPVAAAELPTLTMDVFAHEAYTYAKDNSPKGGNIGQLNNYLIGKYGKNYFRALGYADFRAAIEAVESVSADNNLIFIKTDEPVVTYDEITLEKAAEMVLNYASDHQPQGGNIGQLNNELMNRFGKSYCADLGFADYKSMLSAIAGITVKRNRIYPAIVREEVQPEEPIQETEAAPEPVSDVVAIPAEAAEELVITAEEPKSAEEKTPEKPDMNTIRRDVLNFVATAENGGGLSALGKMLDEKYGKGVLKEMGFTSMRKLAAEVTGIVIRSNKLYIDEAFAQQTEEIEQFVRDFANSDGKRSVRALGMQLKKNFEGFDYRNYGFDRFTDFINAIDGVKADRYHVDPVKES
ncbi:MAG: NYN domain-containing protein [Ruminococcaceae bacterium]|nr:NYN domain-containing protein [Oscillospiraceae bacterium]